MKEGGDDGIGVQVEVGQVDGGFKGVSDVGFAGLAGLTSVAVVGVSVCLLDQEGLVLGKVGGNAVEEGFNFGGNYPMWCSRTPWKNPGGLDAAHSTPLG